jgi:hypothetical protein
MAIRVSINPDTGQTHYDVDGHAILTGPVRGTVVTSDGTHYDVSPDVIEVPLDKAEHVGEIDHNIGVILERNGHPFNTARGAEDYHPLVDEYHHVCQDSCGPLKRTPKQVEAQFAERLEGLGYSDLVGTDAHLHVVGQLKAAAAALGKKQSFAMTNPSLED